jgi:hypothetical protein
MTADMDLPQKLVMQPQEVAKNIYRCQKKKGDMTYTKWLWSVMMLFIRNIPEKIFKRLKL